MQFTGTLIGPDGTSLGPVSGQYTLAARPGSASWSGWIQTSSGRPIPMGGPYTLTLDDGRKGNLKVRWCQYTHGGTIAIFDGIGPDPS